MRTLRVDVNSLQSTLLVIRGELERIVESKKLQEAELHDVVNRLTELIQKARDAVFTAREFREDNEVELEVELEVERGVARRS